MRAIAAALALGFASLVASASQAATTFDGTNCLVFDRNSDGEIARCVARRNDGSTLTLSLHGKAPNVIERIALSIDGKPAFQELSVSARPVIDKANVGLLLTDMNFDGHKDIAIMEFAPAGPNVPYLYFLWEPAARRFAAHAGLAALTAPRFDAESKRIHSHWRESAARGGSDSYMWENGKLTLTSREVQDFSSGTCKFERHERVDGKLTQVKTGDCAK